MRIKESRGSLRGGDFDLRVEKKKRKYKVEKRRGYIRRLDIPICARLIEKTSSKEKSSFRPMPRFALWSLYRQFYGILIIIIIIHKRSLYKNSLDGRQSNDAFLESPSPSKKLMIPNANETRFLFFFLIFKWIDGWINTTNSTILRGSNICCEMFLLKINNFFHDPREPTGGLLITEPPLRALKD